MKKLNWVPLVLTAIVGWSCYPTLQQLALQALGQSALWIILVIYGTAYAGFMITFSLTALITGEHPLVVNRHGLMFGLRFGFCSVIPALCFPLAMALGPGPLVVPPLGYGLIPIANVVICQIIDRRTEHPRLPFYAAVAGLITGVLLTLINRPPPPGHTETKVIFGVWIIFFVMMVICWGFFGTAQQASIEANGNEPLWSLLFLGMSYIFVMTLLGVVLAVYYAVRPNAFHVTWNYSGILCGVISGCAAATGTVCSVYAAHSQRNPIVLSTIQFGSVPVVGVLIAYFAIRPRPPVPLLFWLGVAVVTAAVVLAIRFRPRVVERKSQDRT